MHPQHKKDRARRIARLVRDNARRDFLLHVAIETDAIERSTPVTHPLTSTLYVIPTDNHAFTNHAFPDCNDQDYELAAFDAYDSPL